VIVDLTPLRASRDLRLLLGGEIATGLGTQAALVALPYQLYTQTHSAFLTGLLGAVELVPLVTMSLLGGAVADRADRRRVLLLDQIALVACAAALAALAFAGSPPLVALYGLLACGDQRAAPGRRRVRHRGRPRRAALRGHLRRPGLHGVAVVVAAFPALARFDAEEILAARVGSAP
jgi:MFS family permease